MSNWFRRALPGLLLLLGLGLGVQSGTGQESSGDWVFTALPHADLWFHGMALVDPIGPGPNPLYDPSYPSEVRSAKTEGGLAPSALDQRIGYFRDAFQRDPAFEVLHFLPLYFPRAGREELFTALKLLVGAEEGIPRPPSVNTSFGLAAIGSILASPNQRRVLGEFVAVLEEEWTVFCQRRWREETSERDQILSALQQSWAGKYGPALAPFLDEIGMSGGMVALAPAIGVDGRVFEGSPNDKGDNVLFVSAPVRPDQGREAVYSMLREISFPMVRKVIDDTGHTAANRGEGESLASRAAIRSGALILERYLPEDLQGYQRFFLSQASRPTPAGGAIGAAFLEIFSLEPALEQALREEIFTK